MTRRVLICLFLSSVLASVEIAWQNNLTVSNHDLTGRITVLTSVGVPNLYNALSYTSISYSVQQGNAEADGVYGAAYVTVGGPLAAYLSYFDVTANWASQNPTSADVSLAGNLIGAAYLALVEVDANGHALSGIRLKECGFSVSAVQTAKPLSYATFTGTTLKSGFSNFAISFTFVASDAAGVLTNGAVVTPKSLQTTINILKYPFTDTASKLILIVGLGTASGTASGTISKSGDWNRLTAGSGKNAVFFDGATQAYVTADGQKKTVTIVTSGTGVATTDFDGAGFLSQLTQISNAQHSLVVDYRFVNITFDQSDNITYDPTIGVHSWFSAGASVRVQTPIIALASLLAFVFAKAL